LAPLSASIQLGTMNNPVPAHLYYRSRTALYALAFLVLTIPIPDTTAPRIAHQHIKHVHFNKDVDGLRTRGRKSAYLGHGHRHRSQRHAVFSPEKESHQYFTWIITIEHRVVSACLFEHNFYNPNGVNRSLPFAMLFERTRRVARLG